MLYKYSNHFKFILMIAAGMVASLQNVVMAFMVQSLTNIATNRSWHNLTSVIAIVVISLVAILGASLLFNSLKTSAIKETNTYLRTNLFKGMLIENQGAKNLGFLTNDFKLLETNRFDAQVEIIMQAFTLIFALAYALLVNWLITLLFLLCSFVPMIVSGIFRRKFKLLHRIGLSRMQNMLTKPRISSPVAIHSSCTIRERMLQRKIDLKLKP